MAFERTSVSLLILSALAGLAACDDDPASPSVTDLTIVTTALADGRVGQLYMEGVDAEGGDDGYFWELVAGALPPGLDLTVEDLTDDDVLILGVPETTGTFTFTLRVTSDDGGQADTAELTLEVLPPPSDFRIDNFALPPTVVGGEVAIPLRASGGGTDVVWTVASGALPAGLQLQRSGLITGAATSTGTTRFIVRATSGDESTFKRFTLRVVPNDTTAFQLTMFPVAAIPAEIRPHVDTAIQRWEAVLTGDLEGGMIPADFFTGGGCAALGREANGTAVDDVLVLINIDSIDGAGKVLGRAGPCGVRQNLLPFIGLLTLDVADLMPLVGSSTLTAIIAHEIGHVLGFGSLWRAAMLLEGAGTEDPRFTGERAVAQWQALGGEGAVPVENQGGEGTAGSHLRESVFDRELMTGFSERVGVQQPLSRVTVAAMADLGYAVDLSAADPFALGASFATRRGDDAPPLGWDVVGVGPVRVLPRF